MFYLRIPLIYVLNSLFSSGVGRTETIHRGHHHFPMKRTLFRLYPTRTDAFQLHSTREQQGDKRCSLEVAFV